MAHFVFFDEDTVIQLNSIGPWGLSYVNPTMTLLDTAVAEAS
jgi:hypothetical protein